MPGFSVCPYFGEQTRTFNFDPQIKVHIRAPGVEQYDPAKPTRVVLYALPNGNTIAQTIGCQEREGLDWHYYIQHIGAQTRHLRPILTDCNLVVAYVEAGGRSWPSWRSRHDQSGPAIVTLIDAIRGRFPAGSRVSLTGHSGGGSFIFGYVNAASEIPTWIERIVFLDANYGFSDADQHAEKLVAWLKAEKDHYLGVMSYDDRRIRYAGKLVVSPTGGTYRKTKLMVESLAWLVDLTTDKTEQRARWTGLDGRLELDTFENPDDKILHTVMVEKNGFIHALTFGTKLASQAGTTDAARTCLRQVDSSLNRRRGNRTDDAGFAPGVARNSEPIRWKGFLPYLWRAIWEPLSTFSITRASIPRIRNHALITQQHV